MEGCEGYFISESGGLFWHFLLFLMYLHFGWTNLDEIGDQIEDFLMLYMNLVKFLVDTTLKIFGRLKKQVLKSKFSRHFGYFGHTIWIQLHENCAAPCQKMRQIL